MEKKLVDQFHFAFNIWDFESAKAVIDAAAYAHQDVILQTSTGVYKDLPARSFSRFVKDYAAFKNINAWLNLDHCKEREMLFHAVDSGWDMIMADGSSLSILENINFTNAIGEYAHEHGVLIEAEIGQVKGIEEDVVIQQEAIASRTEIARFLEATDVDFIAVAFGNAHGTYKVKPNLHYELVTYSTSISQIPFVVHGGSGLSDEVLERLIGMNGIKKINFSTDLKLAYRVGMEKSLAEWTQPLAASENIHDEIMKVALSKMNLLGERGGSPA